MTAQAIVLLFPASALGLALRPWSSDETLARPRRHLLPSYALPRHGPATSTAAQDPKLPSHYPHRLAALSAVSLFSSKPAGVGEDERGRERRSSSEPQSPDA
jgi:hypothetical protein